MKLLERRVGPALAVALLSGCSWMQVTPPPEAAPRDTRPECTESRAAPIADTVYAVANFGFAIAGAVMIATTPKSCTGAFCGVGLAAQRQLGGMAVISGLVAGPLYTASAEYGFRNTARCRELHHPSTRERD
jgi:hypothetical protein